MGLQICNPLLLAFLLIFVSQTQAASLSDLKFCSDFLGRVVQANIGRGDNPVRTLQQEFGEEIYSKTIPQGLFELESDVQELFLLAPSLRDMQAFARKWSFTQDQALDVLTYYGTHIYSDLRVAGDLRIVVGRLRTVAKQHYLDTHSALKERQGFYARALTKLSVPEMAEQLGLTEGQVYRELALLEMSIAQAFSNADLSQADAQALRFYQHYDHTSPRGVRWNRIFDFEGERYFEVELAVLLQERFYNSQEIAGIINGLAGENTESENYRSAASVQAKFSELGLIVSKRSSDHDDLYHPQYGYLKENGRLITTSVITFLMDHYMRTDEDLADLLEIPISRLREFMNKHYLVRLNGRGQTFHITRTSKETSALLDQHESQLEVIDKLLTWIKGQGDVPTNSQMRELGMHEAQFYRLFSSSSEAWFALKRAGQEHGIEVPLRNVILKNATDAFRRAVRQEILDVIVHWVRKTGVTLSSLEDVLAIPNFQFKNRARLIGLGVYGAEGVSGKQRIFNSTADFWLNVKEECRLQGVPFRLYSVFMSKSQMTEEWDSALRNEVLDHFLENLAADPQAKITSNFVKKIGYVNEKSLFGYQTTRSILLFNSKKEFLESLHC